VDLAQLDMDWVRRLAGIIELGQRAVMLLGSLLGLAILLVVGNTIRLTILNRREEIVVTKLIGATNAFIRRPFLYTGFWYGLMGAVLAWILVGILLGLLSDPVSRLSFLYNSQFSLGGLDLQTVLLLLGSGVALGLAGSWLAVGRHLQDIEPS
jgi:cell division transport system permease protein